MPAPGTPRRKVVVHVKHYCVGKAIDDLNEILIESGCAPVGLAERQPDRTRLEMFCDRDTAKRLMSWCDVDEGGVGDYSNDSAGAF